VIHGVACNTTRHQILYGVIVAVTEVMRLHIFFGAMSAELASEAITQKHLLSNSIPCGLVGTIAQAFQPRFTNGVDHRDKVFANDGDFAFGEYDLQFFSIEKGFNITWP